MSTDRYISKIMWVKSGLIPNKDGRHDHLYVELTLPEGTARAWFFDDVGSGDLLGNWCIWTDEVCVRKANERYGCISSWNHDTSLEELADSFVDWMKRELGIEK